MNPRVNERKRRRGEFPEVKGGERPRRSPVKNGGETGTDWGGKTDPCRWSRKNVLGGKKKRGGLLVKGKVGRGGLLALQS